MDLVSKIISTVTGVISIVLFIGITTWIMSLVAKSHDPLTRYSSLGRGGPSSGM